MTVCTHLPETPPAPCAVAVGLFDGLHRGHMAVIEAMTSLPGIFARCVFTFSTDSARPDSKTGKRLLSRGARNRLLEAAGVELVLEPEFEDIRELSPEVFAAEVLTKRLNAAHVFCGESFRFGKGAAASAKDLERLLPPGTRAHIVPTVSADGGSVSTTRIRGYVEAGEMQLAASLLGRPFMLDFPVIKGNRIGRTQGWPTINQAFPESFTLPRFGVYASVTTVDGERFKSVTNVGVRPTVGSGGVLAETYIKGFSGDLYGRHTPVELISFIRPERKFASLDELREQIYKDLQQAHEVL